MAWIESHQSLANHRKTLVLQALLGVTVPQAIGHLQLLWWWALDNAPDGSLERIPDNVVARAAQWEGDSETFLKSMIEAGFIDKGPRAIHDWNDYAGRLIAKRQANTQRMRQARATHVLRTCNACAGATVPNSTVPDSTGNPPIVPPLQGGTETQVTGVDVEDAWSRTLTDLEGQMSKGNYRTWLIGTHGLHAVKRDGKVIVSIAAPRGSIAYLNENQKSLCERTLLQYIKGPLEIVFESNGTGKATPNTGDE